MSENFAGILNLVTIEQPQYQSVLKTPAQPIKFPLSEENKALIDAMKLKLFDLGGVGLAAPQVNQPKQIIAIYIPDDAALLRDNVKPYPMHIMINPTYNPIEENNKISDFEACYSVATKAGKVPRFEQIQLSYLDESGRRHESIEKGFYARVLQHEIDHLNGILIIDRLTPDCVQGSLAEIMQLRRQELPDDKKALFDKLMEKKTNDLTR